MTSCSGPQAFAAKPHVLAKPKPKFGGEEDEKKKEAHGKAPKTISLKMPHKHDHVAFRK